MDVSETGLVGRCGVPWVEVATDARQAGSDGADGKVERGSGLGIGQLAPRNQQHGLAIPGAEATKRADEVGVQRTAVVGA